MTHTLDHSCAAPRSFSSIRASGLGNLVRLIDLHRQRRALAKLDAHQLTDIGISRREAEAEARRPLWDAPQQWLK